MAAPYNTLTGAYITLRAVVVQRHNNANVDSRIGIHRHSAASKILVGVGY